MGMVGIMGGGFLGIMGMVGIMGGGFLGMMGMVGIMGIFLMGDERILVVVFVEWVGG